MAMVVRATSSLVTVRLDTTTTGNGAPAPENLPGAVRPRISVSKPSLVVRTESNVRKERIRKPDPPCVVCRGSGRLDCRFCNGRGRTNHIQSTMLPKGEWPKWCRSCGGSGLAYCDRCLGTGEYRHIMGFRFMKNYEDDVQDTERYRRDRRDSLSFTELWLNDDDQFDSGSES